MVHVPLRVMWGALLPEVLASHRQDVEFTEFSILVVTGRELVQHRRGNTDALPRPA